MNAPADTVLRMALAAFAADPTSPLMPVQRQWIQDLVLRLEPLTPNERARLQAPLLAWVRTWLPRSLELVLAQFRDLPIDTHPHIGS